MNMCWLPVEFLPFLDLIDPKTKEIRPEDGRVYTKMPDVADELPDSSPRFILLSYPHTLVSPLPPS